MGYSRGPLSLSVSLSLNFFLSFNLPFFLIPLYSFSFFISFFYFFYFFYFLMIMMMIVSYSFFVPFVRSLMIGNTRLTEMMSSVIICSYFLFLFQFSVSSLIHSPEIVVISFV